MKCDSVTSSLCFYARRFFRYYEVDHEWACQLYECRYA